MNQGLSIALLIDGILLIIWGVNVTGSLSSDVSRFFTDSPTNKAIWLLIGGVGAASVGLFGVFFAVKSTSDRRNTMKSGKRDKVEGNLHQVKGKVKEIAGKVVGNPDLQAEGKAEKIDGEVQKKLGEIKKFVEK